MQKFSFQCFVFKILNQSFEVCNKHLTNKVCGLKPADSNAWHISSVELSPHKHFQKKKLPETRISWHYEWYLKPQSLSLHFDKRQPIDQVPVSATQKNKLHSGSPGVHLPPRLNHNSLFWCPTRAWEDWDNDRSYQRMLKQICHKHSFHCFNSQWSQCWWICYQSCVKWCVNCCKHSLLCSIIPGGLVWVITCWVTLAPGTIRSLSWHWSEFGLGPRAPCSGNDSLLHLCSPTGPSRGKCFPPPPASPAELQSFCSTLLGRDTGKRRPLDLTAEWQALWLLRAQQPARWLRWRTSLALNHWQLYTRHTGSESQLTQ